jgi:RsiW-degrading membrane proteinase PrsW (M82 family)
MNLGSKHPVVWKGVSLGEFTTAEIHQKLSSGEFSRMHRMGTQSGWVSVGEFLDAQRAGDAERAASVANARKIKLQVRSEEPLEQSRAPETALKSQLQPAYNDSAQPSDPGGIAPSFSHPTHPAPWQVPTTNPSSVLLQEILGRIRCVSGPDAGMVLNLGRQPLGVGTNSESAFVSRDPSVAYKHALFFVGEGKLHVQRSSPSAVLMSDGISITDSDWLANGSNLQIGSSSWIFESLVLDSQSSRGGFADAVSRLAGVDSIGGFSFSETFAHVFRNHSDEETELNLACGTISTTPTIEQVSPAFPQPWMFIRTLGISLLAFWLLKFCWSEMGKNPVLIPGLIALGSLATPLSMLILFFELNNPKNISIYQLTKLVVVGGVMSLLFTHILNPVVADSIVEWFNLNSKNNNHAWIAGLVEEPAKMFVLFWMANKRRYEWILNGLLFGAAVGTGFAIFETAGYAFHYLLVDGSANYNEMFAVLFLRGILTPFGGHALMAAIAGAGLWRAKRGRPLDSKLFFSRRFIGPFLVSVGMHALWNSNLEFGRFLGIFPNKIMLIGAVGWIVIIGLVREGLREIATARAQTRSSG